jgi:hypothetical protein
VRSELTRAISKTSFPKGRNKNEESRALNKNKPKAPIRLKNLKIETETLIARKCTGKFKMFVD